MIYQAVNILPTRTMSFKSQMFRLDFCDYSDTYIAVKGRKVVDGNVEANERNKNVRIMIHLCHAYQKSITHL